MKPPVDASVAVTVTDAARLAADTPQRPVTCNRIVDSAATRAPPPSRVSSSRHGVTGTKAAPGDAALTTADPDVSRGTVGGTGLTDNAAPAVTASARRLRWRRFTEHVLPDTGLPKPSGPASGARTDRAARSPGAGTPASTAATAAAAAAESAARASTRGRRGHVRAGRTSIPWCARASGPTWPSVGSGMLLDPIASDHASAAPSATAHALYSRSTPCSHAQSTCLPSLDARKRRNDSVRNASAEPVAVRDGTSEP